ncbi:ABC transporter permease, partial [Roseomonas mucosa]
MRVLALAGRRLLASLPTLLIILVGLFLLLQLAPGDTVDALMAQMGGGDPVQMEQLRQFYGLDAPVAVQLGRYLLRLLSFDLGFSAIYGQPVVQVIGERLPVTLLLMGSALCFSFAAGTALGVLAARRVNRWPDTLISTLGLVFYATPSFWFGLMGIVLFAVNLGWLPAGGFEEIGAGHAGLARVADIAWH